MSNPNVSWIVSYSTDQQDLSKSACEIFEQYLKDNWSLASPAVYWKYWDGHHDYTIKVEEGDTVVDVLTNEWSFYSYRTVALVHLFGRTIKTADAMPQSLISVRQHLENLIKSHSSNLQQNGIYNFRLLRTVQGVSPDESLNQSSRHRIFHIIVQAELFYAKRLIEE